MTTRALTAFCFSGGGKERYRGLSHYSSLRTLPSQPEGGGRLQIISAATLFSVILPVLAGPRGTGHGSQTPQQVQRRPKGGEKNILTRHEWMRLALGLPATLEQ